jgi:cell division septation protein DedD
MSRQVVSRSQRRLEKKQTLVLVVLGLVIALVSYGLGVMVGKSGGDTIVQEDLSSSEHIAIAVPETDAGNEAAQPVETAADPELTFYDTLADGKQPPMGSGINLPAQPPEKSSAAVDVLRDATPQTEVATVKPAPVAVKPKVEAPVSRPVPVTTKPVKQVVASGDYVIQVASVKKAEGAKDLKDRLSKSGYSAYLEKVDLGSKGVWHRIYVGPFATRDAADGAASTLKAAHLATSPLVRKR